MSLRTPKRALIVAVLSLVVGLLALPSQGASGGDAPGSFGELVMDIQRMLTELGYRPGPVDGAMGERTGQAIRRYQSNTGLRVDGHPSESLRQHLLVTTGRAAPGGAPAVGEGQAAAAPREVAWQGRTVVDALLRMAPSGASASRQRLAKGTELHVIRRQGAWLEVRVPSSGAEGWVQQASVRSLDRQAAAPAKKKSGGFFANLSRGIARLLGGSRDEPQDQGNVTVGIRGLAPEDLAATVPDPAQVEKMEGFRADRDAAYRFAGAEQLTAQTVEYFEPAGAGSVGPATSGGRED